MFSRPSYGGMRFIPAHAGNTRCRTTRRRGRPVHPRARGEHHWQKSKRFIRRGSSPRTRGTPFCRFQRRARTRFIPAHAGNTPGRLFGFQAHPVHPRARGEHGVALGLASSNFGSSPRTRGTLLASLDFAAQLRFIPAHAGNTRAIGQTHATHAVHPRARGEHGHKAVYLNDTTGSSPRTRGTPNADGRPQASKRFIPAHAGNTRRKPRYSPPFLVHPRARGEHL